MTAFPSKLDCAGHTLDLTRPLVMGILNVTPDSFSDGGVYFDPDRALEQAQRMVEQGASIIDIGGESTRPGASPVSVEEELRRVVPLVETLSKALPVPISVDTSKPEVMRETVAAGAGMINDIMALRLPGALEAVAQLQVPVCLMHMLGEPRTMQSAPHYDHVVSDVMRFLNDRVEACVLAGIPRERILLDPGFGFGKTLQHNLDLLHALERFLTLELPLLVGISRKSMIGALLGDRPVNGRLNGSLAAAVIAAMKGAAVVRVHDVAETADALKIVAAVR
ncbi:MAG: dihydropteroate synthase [Candidatus Thiodiazotropha sp.]|jgi:dihydropteroate synthase